MSVKTALIVLNYNDYVNTLNYVSLMKEYEIIDKIVIVDNNSTDGMLEKLQLLSSEKVDVVLSDKNGGYSYGNNFGIRYLDEKYGTEYFKYIIISNPDISVEENAIKSCISELESNDKVAIVAPRMHFINGPARRSAWKKRTFNIDIANSTRITEFILFPLFKNGEYSKKEFMKDKLKVDAIAGSFFIIRYTTFKEIGYFDENTFLFFEEDIIGLKLEEKGYEILSLNNIKFIHYDSQSIGKVMNNFRKQDILFDSKKYYHKQYNFVPKNGMNLLEFLRFIRKIELVVETPIVKILRK